VNQDTDFYRALRSEIRNQLHTQESSPNKLVEYLLFGPDLLHLLFRLMLDEDVPAKEKMKVGAAIAYYVSPLDVIPGFILGPVGALDDIAIAAYVIHSLINHSSPEVVRRNWAGDGDVLQLVQNIVAAADNMMGGGFLRRLEGIFNRFFP
jgi:uncharacterized membrane protein YkvA (DUF1232 family)